jgi:hypothetical protein
MTRDDHRAKCIEAMMFALINAHDHNSDWFRMAATAFDSLHGIARVVPVEANNEMIHTGVGAIVGSPESAWINAISCWNAMSAAGNLTNQPEGKP